MKTEHILSDEVLEEVKDTGDWTNDEGEVRELTAADFARMKPFSSLPPDLQRILGEIQRGNVTIHPDPIEEQIPVQLSRSVVERFRAGGPNWETKVDQALRQWLDDHQTT